MSDGDRVPAPRRRRTRSTTAQSLLDLDPELGAGLSAERLIVARQVTVPLARLGRGSWTDQQLAQLDDAVVALLVIDGALARRVKLEDRVSTELLGPGDVVPPRPRPAEVPALLPREVRWNALTTLRLAVIEQHAFLHLTQFPEVAALLVDRLARRVGRLATTQAICQLNRLDRRLLTLFWHLAERWGRVAPDGIVVPLPLPHHLIAELVGARRPSVSSVIAALGRDGHLTRRDDGTWLVTSSPEDVPPPHKPSTVAEQLDQPAG